MNLAHQVELHWRARTPAHRMPRYWRRLAREASRVHPELARRPLFVSALCFAMSIAEVTPALRGDVLRILAMTVDTLPVLERFALERGAP